MDLGLTGKNAIVSASSEGLGKSCALALVREGANVVICARREHKLKEAAQELAKRGAGGARVLPFVCDVTDPEDIKRLVAQTLSSLGTIHILVNNAGGPPRGGFFERSPDDFYETFKLNFMSVVYFCREVIPHMKKQKWGRIINITSVTVKRPIETLVLSSCIRPGVIALTKILSRELGQYGITVNSVCPGYFLTRPVKNLIEMQSNLKGLSEEAVMESLTYNIPVGRMGEPEELGALVAFLASEKASYITGTAILIDGGSYEGIS